MIDSRSNQKFWKINTSNINKYEEFKRFFGEHGCRLEATHLDIKEINADPVTVVAHKASQLDEGILVDDTILDVEGGSFGINIRWLLGHLAEYERRKAEWTVLLAFHQGKEVLIYKGSVPGTIVKPRGPEGFGFDPVFLPNGTSNTLAEKKENHFNARALAVKALMDEQIWRVHPVIDKWEGPWQK
ncbi:MAG: hypothetical protein H0V82_01770 [Candidatus Protochlamydia sp.]|nr:hypothetical protein [Candidatus Protochlamydia sp.]